MSGRINRSFASWGRMNEDMQWSAHPATEAGAGPIFRLGSTVAPEAKHKMTSFQITFCRAEDL